jgi:hypothetical protein
VVTVEVVVRNISPQRPFMRWPDPTTPGNTTKVTYKGCSTCAAAVTEGRGTAGLGTLAKIGLFGFMGLPDDVRARPQADLYTLAESDPVLASIDAERSAADETATRRLAWYAGISWAYAIGASISGYVHGYNRNKKSVGWGLAWGAFGLFFPALSIGWSLGQGYRKPRGRR